MNNDDFEKHKHKTDKLVRNILKKIAKNFGRTYKEALDDFRTHNEKLTLLFWIDISENFGDEFNRVEFCPSCKKFHLFFVDMNEMK